MPPATAAASAAKQIKLPASSHQGEKETMTGNPTPVQTRGNRNMNLQETNHHDEAQQQTATDQPTHPSFFL